MRDIKLEKVDDSYNVVIDDQVVVNLSAIEAWVLQKIIRDNLGDTFKNESRSALISMYMRTWKGERF